MPPRLFRIGLLVICSACYLNAGAWPSAHPQSRNAPTPGAADAHAGTILVFPFENNSKIAGLDWLGEGLAELTVGRLADNRFSVLSRQERLAALEKVGLPAGARYSHATMVKIAAEADADEVVFGAFDSDGKTVMFDARVMHISPPGLSQDYRQTSLLQEVVRAHARFSGQLVCALERRNCSAEDANQSEPDIASLPSFEALENFVHGVLAADDEPRLRALREAARLEPAWDRPAFELGEAYFARHDCDSALPWFSRVPPNRPDGPEAGFDAGVCHLLRNDTARADAAFSELLDEARSADPADRLPEFSEARNNLGVARLRLGKWDEASAEFERAAALDSEEPDYWVNVGIARLAAKQPAAAIAPLERATMLNPADTGARTLVIAVLESLGRGAEADPLRAGAAQDADGHVAAAVPQDPVAIARLARISMRFDRAALRPESEPSTLETSGGNGSHAAGDRRGP